MSWVSRGGGLAVAKRSGYVAAYLAFPLHSALTVGWSKFTVLTFLAWLGSMVVKAWNAHGPENLTVMTKNYRQRKYALRNQIVAMHRMHEMGPQEVLAFREETLRIIALYVRDHQADWDGTKIFVNLLVEDGDDLVVIARNEPHRSPLARYPKAQMAATDAFVRGDFVVIGDLRSVHPAQTGKKYCSILVLPIFLGPKIVGAVSLDSEVRYHFDGLERTLWDGLLPYIALLAWTLAPRHVREALDSGTTAKAISE